MDSRQELLAQLKQPPSRPHLIAVPELVLRHPSQRNNETVSVGVCIQFRRSLLWESRCASCWRDLREMKFKRTSWTYSDGPRPSRCVGAYDILCRIKMI